MTLEGHANRKYEFGWPLAVLVTVSGSLFTPSALLSQSEGG